MNDKQIKQMVDRFLAWKIPDDFYPDAGISYKPLPGNFSQPTGTNLLDATQSEAMIRHIVGDVVDQAVERARVEEVKRNLYFDPNDTSPEFDELLTKHGSYLPARLAELNDKESRTT